VDAGRQGSLHARHLEQVFQGPIGDELLGDLNAHRLEGLTFTYSGGAHILSSRGRGIRKPEDLNGLRVAVFGDPIDTAWLRRLCALMRKDQRAAVAGKAVTDLKAAPIFWSVQETLLCMADLEDVLRRLGYVPVSTKQAARSQTPYPMVWAWCEEERAALDQIFPGQVADITEKVAGPEGKTAKG